MNKVILFFFACKHSSAQVFVCWRFNSSVKLCLVKLILGIDSCFFLALLLFSSFIVLWLTFIACWCEIFCMIVPVESPGCLDMQIILCTINCHTKKQLMVIPLLSCFYLFGHSMESMSAINLYGQCRTEVWPYQKWYQAQSWGRNSDAVK